MPEGWSSVGTVYSLDLMPTFHWSVCRSASHNTQCCHCSRVYCIVCGFFSRGVCISCIWRKSRPPVHRLLETFVKINSVKWSNGLHSRTIIMSKKYIMTVNHRPTERRRTHCVTHTQFTHIVLLSSLGVSDCHCCSPVVVEQARSQQGTPPSPPLSPALSLLLSPLPLPPDPLSGPSCLDSAGCEAGSGAGHWLTHSPSLRSHE